MSGRGTTKAGTFGGRRYREKEKEAIAENRELEILIRQAQAKEKAPFKRVKPGDLALVKTRGGAPLRKDLRGTIKPSEFKVVPQSGKDRDVQLAVNTIPYMYDAGALRLIREEVEQRQREKLNPDVDFEADDIGVGGEEYEEGGAIAEAPQVVAPAEGEEFEGGEVEYGASGWDVADPTDALDLGAFLEAPEEADELGEPLFGMDELTGMVGGDETDTDEEAEEFGRQLEEVDPDFIQKRLKEEIERRRKARGVGSLSAPMGDRIRPDTGYRGFPRDVSGEKAPVSGFDADLSLDASRAVAEDPEPLDFHGTIEHDPKFMEDKEDVGVSRGADPAFSGWASTSGKQDPEWQRRYQKEFLGGLAPVEKHPQKQSVDYYKRVKMTKKEIKEADAKGIKHDGTKLDIGVKSGKAYLKSTDELKALEEGRIMDLRYGHVGKSVAANIPELGFEGGERSKKTKEKDIREGMGYQHGKKKEWELGEGVKRDPRTRKILMDKKGEPKMEKKKLTITGRRKAIEEAWGLSQKGMSRDDNPEQRDAWAGARAIGKEPGKRATKVKEAETKHKLYVKEAREKYPDYVPRGYSAFQYGAGQTEWTKKEDSRKRETIIGTKGGVEYTPEPVSYSAEGTMGGAFGLREAGQTALGIVAEQTPYSRRIVPETYQQAIKGKRRPPGKTINLAMVTNPPMDNLQSQFKFRGQDPMTETSASEVANMSWEEIEKQYGGGGDDYRPDDEGDMTYEF